MKEETKNPILQTILLIEDRIAEILESGDYERSVIIHSKLVFLKRFLEYLRRFHDGDF